MMSNEIFEKKHSFRLELTCGISILIGIGIIWACILIPNFDNLTKGLGLVVLIVSGFLSIVGLVVAYIFFSDANSDYLEYKKLELQ